MITLTHTEFTEATKKVIDGLVPELRKHVCWMADEQWIHSPLIVASALGFFTAAHFNEAYRRKRKLADRYLNNLRCDAMRYLWLIEKPYRFWTFLEIQSRLTDPQYWKCLEFVWTISECVNPEIDTWLALFEAERPYKALLMDRRERQQFAKLPDTLKIYRGYQDGEYDHEWGLSWTLSKEKAVWFAHRFPHNGTPSVLVGQCKKADVFFYTNGRKEHEIVIDPALITDVKVLKKIGPSPFGRQPGADNKF